MEEEEMRRAELDLRETLEGTALEWVLDEVDAATTSGVPQEMLLQRRTRGGSEEWQLVSPRDSAEPEIESEGQLSFAIPSPVQRGARPTGKPRGTWVVTTREMTLQERLLLLIEALRRVLVEVPDIADETLKALTSTPERQEGERVAATGVRFAQDAEVLRRGRSEIVLTGRNPDDGRASLSALLARVAEQVRS